MAGRAETAEAGASQLRRLSVRIQGGETTVVVAVRGAAREVARELGFSVVDQTRVATAVSEITRNIVMYAESGQITISEARGGQRIGIEILAEDEGPGIQDLELVMRGGYSTSGGFGRGIAGARALMDEFYLESAVGKGTRVLMRKWLD
ncbi:MAG: anti-sigma regulatory factor [Bacillota bacterium]